MSGGPGVGVGVKGLGAEEPPALASPPLCFKVTRLDDGSIRLYCHKPWSYTNVCEDDKKANEQWEKNLTRWPQVTD